MMKGIRINKTVSGADVFGALQNQYPNYEVLADKKMKKVFVYFKGKKGVKFEVGKRAIVAEKWNKSFIRRTLFFFLDLDMFPMSKRGREIVSFVNDTFKK